MRLSAGAYSADVVALGSTLHTLTHAGRDLVLPAMAGDPLGLFRGAVLAPWPNRVADGHYTFGGVDHQLARNETARGHALHGFTAGRSFEVVDQSSARLRLRLDLPPQPGYPFPLRLVTTYEMSESAGLRIALTARNVGARPAPYGCAIHPYLTCGTTHVDEAVLELAAASRVEVDDRMIPTGTARVDAVDCDFRYGAVIGARRIDHAFVDLTVGADESMTATVRAPDGRGVLMSWGPWAQWVQVFTSDLPEPEHYRAGLALEPMSCAADAFNSGAGLVVLEPGAEHHAWWVIGAVE